MNKQYNRIKKFNKNKNNKNKNRNLTKFNVLYV